MSEYINPWDALAAHFAPQKIEEMEWDTADNILLAWPTVLEFLHKEVGDPNGKHLLDFGCGAGQFANELSQLGFTVEGMDSSPSMITKARSYYGNRIEFRTGQAVSIKPGEFDVITSIMTLQFVSDINNTMACLGRGLKPGGHLVFAVHNPEFVRDWLRIGYRYADFDSIELPTKGMLSFGDTQIPIFLRGVDDYNQLAKNYNLNPRLEKYPPFNREFLDRYHVDGPTEHSEYLILGYQKSD